MSNFRIRMNLTGAGLLAFSAAQLILLHSPLDHLQAGLRWSVYVLLDKLGCLGPKSGDPYVVILGDRFGVPSAWVAYIVNVLTVQVIFVPALVCGLLVYHFLTSRKYSDGRTRCGRCWSVLSGLTEPQCPRCGEPL